MNMKYGVLGTGDVARTIGDKLIELGHSVMIGSRTADNPQAAEWAKHHGKQAVHGTFADAARFGERIFNCVQGIHAIEALNAAGKENLNGIMTSLGEEVQRLLPQTKVVKTLNYLHNYLMIHPDELPEPVTGFYCGNNKEAKAEVEKLLADFGWRDTMDLGDISMSRYTEMLGAFWPAALNGTGHMRWGFRLVR